jgi:tRNA pseudouridine38-40 synthase
MTGAVRVRLDLAYDGTDFSGWAAQPGRRTVEGTLVDALTTILRAPQPVRVTVAGRTDAGVHARGQVAHADLRADAWAGLPGRSTRSPAAALVTRLGGILPADVVVSTASVAPEGFDARFAATSRRYSYRIADEAAARDPMRRRDTVWLRAALDEVAMTRAGARLVGLHDFAAFCKRREGASTTRTLLELSWTRLPDGVLEARVVADAFCHSMVRSLVGAVIPVGEGREPAEWPATVLAGRERIGRVRVMPAHGLCLEEVAYPPDGQLVARVVESRSRRSPA